MGVQWTPEQRKAIALPSGKGNILVSAAAGSGKTAVLVERICEKIRTDKTDIDKFLIVTFTRAAAAGMKAKIEQRFIDERERAANDDERRFWMRQRSLLSMADITTIDAFCLNVVKNNFQHIGIDPNFFIMDGTEYRLLRANTAESLFDKLYESEDADFVDLVDKYADFRSDDKLMKLLFHIDDFISDFAEPIKWLEEKAEMYTEDPEKSPWPELFIHGYVHKEAENAKRRAEDLLDKALYSAAGLESGFFENTNAAEQTREIYGRAVDSLLVIHNAAEELLEAKTLKDLCKWNLMYDSGAALFADTMPARITAKEKETEGLAELIGDTRELKKSFEAAMAPASATEPSGFFDKKKAAVLRKTAQSIVKLVRLFEDEMKKAKHKRSAYTFLDIEHMAFELFKENDNIRRSYAEKYSEILIDEYQDTIGLQDGIFELISHDNIFMVGDLKQSIYRFRGGDPYIFKEKGRVCELPDSTGTKVLLSKNFRSRNEVIESINDIFSSIMTEEAGDVDYSGDEMLVCGIETPDGRDDFYRSELHIITNIKENNDELSAAETEAAYMAQRIKELHGKKFFDLKAGTYRPLRYSDFTILLREIKISAKVYEKVFLEYGIPCFTEINDYFENSEIKVMTSLLAAIDNVRQDVPIVAALRSALFGFTDSELAYIKTHFGKGKKCFYECIKACAASDGRLSGRCRHAVGSFERWRRYTKVKSVANLVWSIYEETGFYDCAASAEGEEAQINLRLLYERAKQYESSGFKGLFGFVNYINSLKGKRDDIAGARVMRHDAVSIMTIHKSKGLEFPVVLCGGMGRQSLSEKPGGDGRVPLHKQYGLGFAYPDTEHGFYGLTPFKLLTASQNRREDVSENMRLLYVALTRAQCKLIVTGMYNFKDENESIKVNDRWLHTLKNGRMAPSDVMACRTYGDWMIPAALKSDAWDVIFVSAESIAGEEPQTETAPRAAHNKTELKEAVYRLLDYRYPYEASTVIPSRTTATEMKEMRTERSKPQGNISSLPDFLSDSENPAERGTAYHNAAAYIDLDALRRELTADTVISELRRLTEEGYVNARYADSKMAEKLLEMFKSSQGRRMLKAKKVFREKKFQMLLDAKEYDPYDTSNEKMILQGVIDCFFIENDGNVVLMDYKTDKITNGNTSEAEERYALQLELYSKAIEKVAGLNVNERYLYLFDINHAVKI